jgi:hypothetical protein
MALMLEDRVEAWKIAVTLVDPIVEKHGLDAVKLPSPAFTYPPISTKVDQHVEHILRVASWLIGLDY